VFLKSTINNHPSSIIWGYFKYENENKSPYLCSIGINIFSCFVIYVVLVSIFFLVSCTANLELRKNQEEALRNFGEAYIREGAYTKALRKLLEAEKLYAEDPHLQYDLGLVYMAKEKPNKAIEHFKKAVEIKPDYTPAKNSLGVA
jgi:tetratricopeptide (TPR) repeat protein